MTASLIVAGYELLGGTTNPEYRLAPGFAFGEGEPDQVTIASLYLDGEAVTGTRTRNRNMQFPLTVFGTGPAGASGLSARVTTLLQAVFTDTFTVQWTPDGGQPIVFDCYRATWRRPRNLVKDAAGQTQLILEFQALPFGRSPTAQTISVTSTTQIDSFDTAPTGGTLSTSQKVEGTGSAIYVSGTPVSRTFAAKNLSAAAQVTFWLMTTATSGSQAEVITAALTLGSAGGSTTYTATVASRLAPFGWRLCSISLLAGGVVASGSGVSLGAVTNYSLKLTHATSGGASGVIRYVDNLSASGSASAQTATTHAAALLVPGVVGSARTPANIALTNGGTFSWFLLHAPPQDQDANAEILSSLSTGSTDQTITLVKGNALAGTYSLVLGVGTSGGGAVTATVTIQQVESAVNVGSATVLTKTYTSGALLIPLGEVTLPLYAIPSDNTLTTFTIRVQISGADRYSEVMLLDTAGQTVFNDASIGTRGAVYVDEPSSLQSGPSVYTAATAARDAAFSVLDKCIMSGGPILLDPGTNRMLAWVGTSTPALAATYYPRWLDERTD